MVDSAEIAIKGLRAVPKQNHILVVDDDARLRGLLERYLHEQGYAVSTAENTKKARHALSLFTPDIMVLDVMMPEETGLEFSEKLREQDGAPPILMLTAMDTPADRIAGLESGVEDYLTKPFEPRELLLRLENILKRNTFVNESSEMVTFGDLTFTHETQQLMDEEGNPLRLTTTERDMLSVLAANINQPVSREKLGKTLESEGSPRHIDVQIGRLRKKLGDSSLIQTVRGKGYRLVGA